MGSVPGCLPPLSRRRSSDDLDSCHETDVGGAPMSTSGSGAAVRDLHIKLAHIQWRKQANGKSIRKGLKALDTTKRLHERDMMLQLSVDREGERERWTEAIVRDELARPAEISETFLKDWEQREEEGRNRRLEEARLHLKSLKRVERVVQSKQDEGKQQVERSDAEEGRGRRRGQGKHQLKQQEDTKLLRERLQRLRIGVKEKRRGLRRSASASKDLRSTFSATSFKTGRGRW
ncbi:unnamed protein product [Pylaiella littoralis]